MRRRLIYTEIEYANICLVENSTLNKFLINGKDYSSDIYPLSEYIPIGVEVVPSNHTDDGTTRIIGLALMDRDNPDNGNNTGSNIYMSFGINGSNISTLNKKTVLPTISNDLREISGEQKIVGWVNPLSTTCYFPSDYLTIYNNPYDKKTFYRANILNLAYRAVPSPYLNDGSKNEIYHSTINTGNILSDMDGKGNTEKILEIDNSESTSWQTATTIQAATEDYIHPGAQCCWRYHTVGTNQGDWYLPSAGELGYLISRLGAITNSLEKLNEQGVISINRILSGIIMSSTENSSDKNIMFYNRVNCFEIYDSGTKSSNQNVYAFLKF